VLEKGAERLVKDVEAWTGAVKSECAMADASWRHAVATPVSEAIVP
jgi:hypothetical protein